LFSKIIPFVFLSTLTANASTPEVYNVRPAMKATYLASDSICLDGLGVILNGHGCSEIFITTINGHKNVTCTDKKNTDPILYSTYIVVESGQSVLDEHKSYQTMCADSNMVILRSAP
jgi:hypothetical protein